MKDYRNSDFWGWVEMAVASGFAIGTAAMIAFVIYLIFTT